MSRGQLPKAVILVPEASLRESLTSAAANLGYETATCHEPGALREYCRQNAPHLLIADWSSINEELIDSFRQELEDTNEQLEAAIMRANQLAMEAELAYIELNQIFRTAPGGILLIDRDFNILRHNAAFLKMAGTEAEKVAGSKCYQVFGSSFCHSPECLLTRIIAGEESIQCESQRRVEGAEVHYLITCSPFRAPDGELVGAVLHFTDITGRVQAEP